MRARIGHPFLLAQYDDAQCARHDPHCLTANYPTTNYPTGDYTPVGHLAGKNLAHLHGGSCQH